MPTSAACAPLIEAEGATGPLHQQQLHLLQLGQQNGRHQMQREHLQQQQLQCEHLQWRQYQHEQVQRQQVQRRQLQQQLRQLERQEQQQLLVLEQHLQQPHDQSVIGWGSKWRRRKRHERLPLHQQGGAAVPHEKGCSSGEQRGALRLVLSPGVGASRLLRRQRFNSPAIGDAPYDSEEEEGGKEEDKDGKNEDEDKVEREGQEEEQGAGEAEDDGEEKEEATGGSGAVESGAVSVSRADIPAAPHEATTANTGAPANASITANETEQENRCMGTNTGSERATAAAEASETKGVITAWATTVPATPEATRATLGEGRPYAFLRGTSSRRRSSTNGGNCTSRRLREVSSSLQQQRELDSRRSMARISSASGCSTQYYRRSFLTRAPELALEVGEETNNCPSLVEGSNGGANWRYSCTRFRSWSRYGGPSCHRNCTRSSGSNRNSSCSDNNEWHRPRGGRCSPLSCVLNFNGDAQGDGSGRRGSNYCYSRLCGGLRDVIELEIDEGHESYCIGNCVAPEVAVGAAVRTSIGECATATDISCWGSSTSNGSTGSSHSSDSIGNNNNGTSTSDYGNNGYNDNSSNSTAAPRPFECSLSDPSSPRRHPLQFLFPLRLAAFCFGAGEAPEAAHFSVEPGNEFRAEAADPSLGTALGVTSDPSDDEPELCGLSFPAFSVINGHCDQHQHVHQRQLQRQPQQRHQRQRLQQQRHQLQQRRPVFVRNGTTARWYERNEYGHTVAGGSSRNYRAASVASSARDISATGVVAHPSTGTRSDTVGAVSFAAPHDQTVAGEACSGPRRNPASAAERVGSRDQTAETGARLTPQDRIASAAASTVGAAPGNTALRGLAPRDNAAALGARVAPLLHADAASVTAHAALPPLGGRPTIAIMRPPMPRPFEMLPYIMVPRDSPTRLQVIRNQRELQQQLANQQRRLFAASIPPSSLVTHAAAATVATEVISHRQTRLMVLPRQNRPQLGYTMTQTEAAVAEANAAIENVLVALQRHQQLFSVRPTGRQPQRRGTPAHVLGQLPTLPFKPRPSASCRTGACSSSCNSSGGSSSSSVSNRSYSSTDNSRKRVGEIGDKEKCAICLELFVEGRLVRFLPCLHFFHVDCVDTWLGQSDKCPICKWPVHCAALSDAEALAEERPPTASSSRVTGAAAGFVLRGLAAARDTGDLLSVEDPFSEDDAYGSAYAQ